MANQAAGSKSNARAVDGTHRTEVAVVKRRDPGCLEAFRDCHDRRIGCSQGEVGVPSDQIGHPTKV
jgi:hypothetical protein